MKEVYDHIIIGGGVAGLSISALLEKEKSKTLLLESHSLLGGCASYFERAGYSFDVGATTLSGLKEKRPLYNFLKAIDLELETIKIDPGMISILENQTIKHFANEEKIIQEFQQNFQSIDPIILKKFLTEMRKIENISYQAIFENQLPIRNLATFLSLMKLTNFKYLHLLPLLNKSFIDYLKDSNLQDKKIIQIFDELLFITAQNQTADTPALFGILGANYPEDTHYHLGGMQGFILKLKSKIGPFLIRHKVEKISKTNGLFKIETNKGDFYSKKIISTLPRTNNLILLNQYIKNNNEENETYSAYTLYFTIPQKLNLDSLYYQVHTTPLIHAKTISYFVSFSHPNDQKRNINHRQTVTISTHVMPSVFKNLKKEDYQKKKEELKNNILQHFSKCFDIDLTAIDHLEMGTSKTFEKFTHRFNGSVGGLGHSLKKGVIKKAIHQEIKENFFEIGDNVFPGQGIAAVIYGAMSLKKQL